MTDDDRDSRMLIVHGRGDHLSTIGRSCSSILASSVPLMAIAVAIRFIVLMLDV